MTKAPTTTQKSDFERHLIHKFAIELAISRSGFPWETSFLPSDATVEVWKECYRLETKELDPWYYSHLKDATETWKAWDCKPRHIPKVDSLLPT